MSAPAAISGTFSDFRTVKGRKVCQLVIEIPVEQADAALQVLGGVPQPHDPKWVAIARLDPNAASKDSEPKERKAWADLPPSQQAAIRCTEEDFHRFIHNTYAKHVGVRVDATYAAEVVRQTCGVASRKDLNDNHRARVIWHQLDTEYLQWSGRAARG